MRIFKKKIFICMNLIIFNLPLPLNRASTCYADRKVIFISGFNIKFKKNTYTSTLYMTKKSHKNYC